MMTTTSSSNTDSPAPEDNNGNDDHSIVSLETSKRICGHMNEDHSVTVYAMARQQLGLWLRQQQQQFHPNDSFRKQYQWWWWWGGNKFPFSNAILKSVTAHGCQIQIILCNGDVCQMVTLDYPFQPPLKKDDKIHEQLRRRFIEIHQQVCRPYLTIGSVIVASIVGLWAVCVRETMNSSIQQPNNNNNNNNMSSNNNRGNVLFLKWMYTEDNTMIPWMVRQIQTGFWMVLVLHCMEALYATYGARSVLKLSWKKTMIWLLSVIVAGFPMTLQLHQLLHLDHQAKQAKKEKNH